MRPFLMKLNVCLMIFIPSKTERNLSNSVSANYLTMTSKYTKNCLKEKYIFLSLVSISLIIIIRNNAINIRFRIWVFLVFHFIYLLVNAVILHIFSRKQKIKHKVVLKIHCVPIFQFLFYI